MVEKYLDVELELHHRARSGRDLIGVVGEGAIIVRDLDNLHTNLTS